MKLGQHFLMDRGAISRIASYADLGPEDNVLEIGPGPGNLTEALASRVGRVYAVEIDSDLAGRLSGRFSNVQVINEDALKVELPDYNKIVSNLPYQISSRITYRLLSRPFETAVLMYQWEFAKRLAAAVGDSEYGRLAMAVGFFCRIEILEKVSKMAFRPVPQVDSAIVRLLPRSDRPKADPADFLRLAEGLFNNRRKKVKKGLAALGAGPRALAELDASLLERRPEDLTPDEAASLVGAITRKSGTI
ncbi:MAG: 16S rRNA (adenine(1518)-N(6)/adenine(1519)-N(6))-dimethyltransferase RsmA [Methanothrix sp.]|nr:16S rRNA (adenine(1518)-N(6)/adenine(1519)-N(6))-dimethyltransferase RsmA [Methanothrix sp.]